MVVFVGTNPQRINLVVATSYTTAINTAAITSMFIGGHVICRQMLFFLKFNFLSSSGKTWRTSDCCLLSHFWREYYANACCRVFVSLVKDKKCNFYPNSNILAEVQKNSNLLEIGLSQFSHFHMHVEKIGQLFKIRVFPGTNPGLGVDGPHNTVGHLQNTPRTPGIHIPLAAAGSQSAL